jgi:serine phosphatase RsbU (regulator of sigma subunit)/anti-sigma regulatory factor (Ser/Thr protein kinase)
MSEIPGASRPAALRFALPCDLKQVRHAAQTVHRFLAEQGCDEQILSACDLALVEACNNAIKYAPETVQPLPVLVEVISNPTLVELRVTDHTRGFDWPKRIELPDPESESGRGLYLIQSLMDSAGYLRGNGENILVLRKARASSVEGGSPQGTPLDNDRLITGLLEELSSCYESLSAIFRYGTEQNKITDLARFARRLFSDLAAIVGAEWFVFRIVQNQSWLEVLASSDPAFDGDSFAFRGEGSQSAFLEAEAAVSRNVVWLHERRAIATSDPLRVVSGGRGLVHPVFVGGNFIGTLALGKNPGAPSSTAPVFSASQTNVIATFAHFLAMQIVNARFQEEQVANRIIARELEIAGSIQQSLLLKELPQIPGFELAALCRSAHQVGGDFYDVMKISNDSALLVIADVMGKGVLAAMFAAILRTVLRASPELMREPAALLTRVNQLLFQELSGVDMFITAQLVYVDASAHRLVIASAGHCPLLVANGAGVKSFSPEGMPLGIVPDTVFAGEMVELSSNCRVLLYTDGLTEALDGDGERYGQERLATWLNEAKAATARELKDQLAEKLAQFQMKTGLNDDQTFLIMTG